MPQDKYQAMHDAYKLLQEAHATFEKALATAKDPELSPAGVLAISQSGRAYAEAVMRYSNATMSFLALMESNRERAFKKLRNAASGN